MKNYQKLFIIGLVVHIVYVLIICYTDNILSGFLQEDNGPVTESISKYYPDSESYIESAENFLEYGVFGKENNPDYHRTIGYPLIICFFKVVLGHYWYYGLMIFQILLGALIYPTVYGIGISFFPKRKKGIFYSTIVLILLGGYFTKSMYVLTDLTFAFFFLLGIYLSITSITSRKKILLITCGVILLSFGALVRPSLILYPIVHFLLLLYIAKDKNIWIHNNIKRIVWGSSIILILMCNLSSFRLYSSYGNFSPTDILGINMFRYSVNEILSKKGEKEKYLLWESEIKSENNWLNKDKLRKEKFFETVSNYPGASISYWTRAAQAHLFSPHYMEIGFAYGYYKRDIDEELFKLRKSVIMQGVFYIFYFLNVLIFLLGFLYLCYKMSKKEYLFVLTFLCAIFLIIGPSFLAETSPRMRIPVEPFLLILAFQCLENRNNIIKNILQRTIAKKT